MIAAVNFQNGTLAKWLDGDEGRIFLCEMIYSVYFYRHLRLMGQCEHTNASISEEAEEERGED